MNGIGGGVSSITQSFEVKPFLRDRADFDKGIALRKQTEAIANLDFSRTQVAQSQVTINALQSKIITLELDLDRRPLPEERDLTTEEGKIRLVCRAVQTTGTRGGQ